MQQEAAQVTADPQTVELGRGRYVALACGSCHEDDGKGNDQDEQIQVRLPLLRLPSDVGARESDVGARETRIYWETRVERAGARTAAERRSGPA